MHSILMKGVIRTGRVEIDEPIDLPDGTEVLVTSGAAAFDDGRPMSPSEIAHVLASMDTFQPLDLTDAERVAWEAERQGRKAWEKARFADQSEKLRSMWDDPVPPR